MAVVRVSDVIVPELFTQYTQQQTERKSRLIQAGIARRSPFLDAFLAGPGLTVNIPSFQDLADDEERVATDDATQRIPEDGSGSAPNTHGKISTSQEVAVRLTRNFSWSAMKLAAELAGADPLGAIQSRVSTYWTYRTQKVVLAGLAGVFADNDAAPSGSEHVQGDLTHDIKGGGYVAGVTDFSAEGFIDTLNLMGDSEADLGVAFMHSVVFNRARKNNLIDFIPDSINGQAVQIPTFLGRRVVQDDGMPNPSSGVFHTYLLGAGSVQMGVGTPERATSVEWKEEAGQGNGQEILWNRVLWVVHPSGHAYVGSSPNGGPSNAATANNLAHADSWKRVFPERKQIKIARLITREF